MSADVGAWMDALFRRHIDPLGMPAFLKAVRALSVRYVERRHLLGERSPIDSAGKRAAFAAFFAPLHFITLQTITQELRLGETPLKTVVDLGCGTGIAGAVWALTLSTQPALIGIDVNPWAVDETNWTWGTLGLRGRARRGDVLKTCMQMREPSSRSASAQMGIVLAWTVNELSDDARRALLPLLLDLSRRGSLVLVVEPIAQRAAPWWNEWAAAFTAAGGTAKDWMIDRELPERLAELDRAAGFRRDDLRARSLSAGL